MKRLLPLLVLFSLCWHCKYEEIAPLYADFTMPTTRQALVEFQFTDASEGAVTWAWNFGNGQTSNNKIPPLQTYLLEGTYTVTLTVTNGKGATDTKTLSVPVGPPPAVVAAFNAPSYAEKDQLVTFISTAYFATAYAWDFGDGGTSNTPNPQHAFSAIGKYNVTLSASNSNGAAAVTHPIEICTQPVAAFSTANNTYQTNTPVAFTNASTENASNNTTSYFWDFGNGTVSTDKNPPVQTYSTAGIRTVSLTVTNPCGSSTAYKTLTIFMPTTPPVAAYQYSPTTNIIADVTPVYFDNTSTGTVTGYAWDFGLSETGSSEEDPVHVFNTEGSKNVRLTATGPLGTNSILKNIFVHAMDPGCFNYTGGSTQSTSAIQFIRNNNLMNVGNPVIDNNYGANIKIELFHSDDWLAGIYSPFGNSYWSLVNGGYTSLWYNNQQLIIGDDWGVRISFSNGIVSCIRTVKDVSTYNGSSITIVASRIFDGN